MNIKNEIIMIDNQPIITSIHQKNGYNRLEIDTIKTPYDFSIETIRKLNEEIHKTVEEFNECIKFNSRIENSKTYFSTPEIKKDIFETMKNRLFQIIKNPKSYERIE